MTQNIGKKVWGMTTPLVRSPMFEMHRLTIKPWHQCSVHTHQFKHNAFYVLSGTLYIDWWDDCKRVNSYRLASDTVLAHGTVGPGVRHRFRTASSACVALEMYYTEALSEDIQRQNVGGPV